MNDFFEIPRGGDNKRPDRGRGGRRLPRSSRQEEQGTGSPTGGEDTTEIPRSTTQVSMQLTMERMRRAAPARKLNKAPGQGEECSKSENRKILYTEKYLSMFHFQINWANLSRGQLVWRCKMAKIEITGGKNNLLNSMD